MHIIFQSLFVIYHFFSSVDCGSSMKKSSTCCRGSSALAVSCTADSSSHRTLTLSSAPRLSVSAGRARARATQDRNAARAASSARSSCCTLGEIRPSSTASRAAGDAENARASDEPLPPPSARRMQPSSAPMTNKRRFAGTPPCPCNNSGHFPVARWRTRARQRQPHARGTDDRHCRDSTISNRNDSRFSLYLCGMGRTVREYACHRCEGAEMKRTKR